MEEFQLASRGSLPGPASLEMLLNWTSLVHVSRFVTWTPIPSLTKTAFSCSHTSPFSYQPILHRLAVAGNRHVSVHTFQQEVVKLRWTMVLVNDASHKTQLFFIPAPFGVELGFFAKPKNITSQSEAKIYIMTKASSQDHIFVSHMEVGLVESGSLCSS